MPRLAADGCAGQVLGAILHLGNIQFGADREGGATLDANDATVVCCAEMLGCNLQKLVDSFVLRNIQAGPTVGGELWLGGEGGPKRGARFADERRQRRA